MNCVICKEKAIFDKGFCSIECLDWYNKEIIRQQEQEVKK